MSLVNSLLFRPYFMALSISIKAIADSLIAFNKIPNTHHFYKKKSRQCRNGWTYEVVKWLYSFGRVFYTVSKFQWLWTNHVNAYATTAVQIIWWRHQMETFSALFVGRIHQSPVYFPHKAQWRGALMISLICAWITMGNHIPGSFK